MREKSSIHFHHESSWQREQGSHYAGTRDRGGKTWRLAHVRNGNGPRNHLLCAVTSERHPGRYTRRYSGHDQNHCLWMMKPRFSRVCITVVTLWPAAKRMGRWPLRWGEARAALMMMQSAAIRRDRFDMRTPGIDEAKRLSASTVRQKISEDSGGLSFPDIRSWKRNLSSGSGGSPPTAGNRAIQTRCDSGN